MLFIVCCSPSGVRGPFDLWLATAAWGRPLCIRKYITRVLMRTICVGQRTNRHEIMTLATSRLQSRGGAPCVLMTLERKSSSLSFGAAHLKNTATILDSRRCGNAALTQNVLHLQHSFGQQRRPPGRRWRVSDRERGVASSLIPALGVSRLGLRLGDGAAGITGPADRVRRQINI